MRGLGRQTEEAKCNTERGVRGRWRERRKRLKKKHRLQTQDGLKEVSRSAPHKPRLSPHQVWADLPGRPREDSAIQGMQLDAGRSVAITASNYLFFFLLRYFWKLAWCQMIFGCRAGGAASGWIFLPSACEFSLSVPNLIWIILKGCFPSVSAYNLAALRTGWFHAWFDPVPFLTKGLEINRFIFISIIRSHLYLTVTLRGFCIRFDLPKCWLNVSLWKLEYNHQLHSMSVHPGWIPASRWLLHLSGL